MREVSGEKNSARIKNGCNVFSIKNICQNCKIAGNFSRLANIDRKRMMLKRRSKEMFLIIQFDKRFLLRNKSRPSKSSISDRAPRLIQSAMSIFCVVE